MEILALKSRFSLGQIFVSVNCEKFMIIYASKENQSSMRCDGEKDEKSC